MTSPHTTSRRSRSTPSLQQLVVSEQLTALSLASWAHLDEEGGAEVDRYFTPDGLWDLGSVRYRGREEIREAMRRRAASARCPKRHVLSNLRVTVADDDAATLHAVLSVHVADTGPAVMGDLVEACTRQAGGNWLIGTRTFRPAFAGDPGTAGEGHAVDLEALVL